MATSEPSELTDQQIELLLQKAEHRIRNQSTVARLGDHNNGSFLPRTPALQYEQSMKPYVQVENDVAHVDSHRTVETQHRRRDNQIKKVEDPVVARARKAEAKKATTGEDWFNMPRTVVTPQLKQDLQLLKMRSVLDPKRHYKKEGGKMKLPEYSQVGTMTEGPTEFYSARMSNADRKRTLVEEVLAGERDSGRFKRKYNEIQDRKTSGKKAHYKAKMVKKYGKMYKKT